MFADLPLPEHINCEGNMLIDKIANNICFLRGGGGVHAYNFGNFDNDIRVEGEGQDTSRLFKAGFGSMRTILPM